VSDTETGKDVKGCRDERPGLAQWQNNDQIGKGSVPNIPPDAKERTACIKGIPANVTKEILETILKDPQWSYGKEMEEVKFPASWNTADAQSRETQSKVAYVTYKTAVACREAIDYSLKNPLEIGGVFVAAGKPEDRRIASAVGTEVTVLEHTSRGAKLGSQVVGAIKDNPSQLRGRTNIKTNAAEPARSNEEYAEGEAGNAEIESTANINSVVEELPSFFIDQIEQAKTEAAKASARAALVATGCQVSLQRLQDNFEFQIKWMISSLNEQIEKGEFVPLKYPS